MSTALESIKPVAEARERDSVETRRPGRSHAAGRFALEQKRI